MVARSQIAAGDYGSAANTLNEVEARNPNNSEAKALSLKLSEILSTIQDANLYKTRADMLNAVDDSWQRPNIFELEGEEEVAEDQIPYVQQKLEDIIIPRVYFHDTDVYSALETLSELAFENDPKGEGVDFVIMSNSLDEDSGIYLNLREKKLADVLNYLVGQVNHTINVTDSVVEILAGKANGGSTLLSDASFPLTEDAFTKMTGIKNDSKSDSSASSFDSWGAGSSDTSSDEKTDALRKFFQDSGINFDDVEDSSISFAGGKIYVVQTPLNIKRIEVIVEEMNVTQLVEIESKFLEVSQNDLEELGFNWGFLDTKDNTTTQYSSAIDDTTGLTSYTAVPNGAPAALSTQFRGLQGIAPGGLSNASANIISDGVESNYAVNPPQISGTLDYATGALPLFADTFTDGDYNIDLKINALARKSGSDLMSAPKVTVISGQKATITVAQKLLYPTEYEEIQSTVSSGGDSASSAISITAGTPKEFKEVPVGVSMEVTPTVQVDDQIHMVLAPSVTEFEGFVEYGGPSIALTGNTTAVVPSGFYQPVFSTREIDTQVLVSDGATVVMGGLTRDEVRSVNDRVPILGDIPVLGRLFRSEGETRQKRNLLIFVTANLVSSGGSLKKQSYDNIDSETLYQTPAVTTPSGNRYRNITVKE